MLVLRNEIPIRQTAPARCRQVVCMNTGRSILIVDDDPTFLKSTAELLSRDGYRCDCAADAGEAIAKTEENHYDVLISDVRTCGDANLRLVREARQLSPHTSVILVTAHPTVDTAIRAIELLVMAYLRKPLDHEQLKLHLEKSVVRSRGYRMVSHVRQLLEQCVYDLQHVEETGRPPKGNEQPGTTILPATLRTLSGCLSTLLELQAKTGLHKLDINLCEMLNCPQWRIHRRAILDAVSVLKETRRRFKSKELGELRANLESLVSGPEDAGPEDAAPDL